MDGWIRLHKQILEWEHYEDAFTFKLFVHILLTANFKDRKYMGFLVPRGSRVIKEYKIGDECGLTYQEVRTAMGKLLKSGEITKKATNKFTIVSIVNYDVYQTTSESSNEQSTNNQRTINELSTSIEEEVKERMNEKKKNKNILSGDPTTHSQIIDHLNLRAGTKYKPSSKPTKEKINTRLNEGYTLDDFIAVIDKKCDEWLGTEQEKYLRPETLFGSKFEGYMNQKIVKAQPQKPQSKFVNYAQRTDWDFDKLEQMEREYLEHELQNCEGADDRDKES